MGALKQIGSKSYVSPKSVHNKRRRKEKVLLEYFQECEELGSCVAVARRHADINVRTLQRKYRQYKAAQAKDTRLFRYNNQQKQAFMPEEEGVLAAHINAIIEADEQVVTEELAKEIALLYYQELHPRRRNTRTHEFTASTGWCQRFKARWKFPSNKIKPVTRLSRKAAAVSAEKEVLFKNEVVATVTEYGSKMVLNMDETPVKCVEMPIKGWNQSGSRKPLKTMHKGNVKQSVTAMPTITAAGTKLPFAWINAGKTDLAISRMQLPKNVHSYYSESGWVNSGIMQLYIKDVLLPYTKKRPCALLLDNYGAHWDESVLELCRRNKVRLIEVPEGKTSSLQPLDYSVNGPMKKMRQRLYVQQRFYNPDESDTVEKAVLRTIEALNNLKNSTIMKGWIAISDLLNTLYATPTAPNKRESCL